MHLQFKFTFLRKNQVNIKILKNIPKSHRKVPNWKMCFKVLYKCHRKNLKTKKNTLPSVGIGTRQRNLFAKCQACSTRQRQHVCRVLTDITRQRMTEGPPASPEVFCRGLFFAECLTFDKEDVCRVSLFAECLTLGKDGICRGPDLPSAALGKLSLCRVPVFRHSTKLRALSKEHVSCSVHSKSVTDYYSYICSPCFTLL